MWSAYKGTLTHIQKQQSLPQDVHAGLTVAAVALPLNLALAVASGLPPAAGLVAGAIGGFIAAFIGGAPLQVTGPAAALSSIVMGIALGFGPQGVAMTALIVGGFQLILAFTRAGHLMAKVPESVLAGFTTGVGIKLLDQQIPELLGSGAARSDDDSGQPRLPGDPRRPQRAGGQASARRLFWRPNGGA